MAAEYQLYTNDEIKKEDITDIFSKLNWQWTEEKIGERGFVFSFTSIVGFLLHLISIVTTIEIDATKLTFRNVVTFRFSKEIHFLTAKKNMLRCIVELMKIYDGDLVLLFNGEIIILTKNQGDELVLSNTDFWTEELLKELNNMSFRSRSFKVL